MQEINTKEIDARINMLTQQRDSANNMIVVLAGKLALLEEELENLKKKDSEND